MTVIGEIVATVGMALLYLRDHPEVSERLLQGILALLHEREEYVANIEATRALAAGLAASRANAVQAFKRRLDVSNDEMVTPEAKPR